MIRLSPSSSWVRARALPLIVVFTTTPALARAPQPPRDYLASNTVLIIRHAEKPPLGRELTPAGRARAAAYIRYFEPFRDAGSPLRVNALYAGADSHDSIRPRLTLEPLARSNRLPVNSTISTKDPAALVTLLRTQPHGNHPLIAWRHHSIPALLAAFGASPDLIPDGKWPNNVYDWVVVLRFDRAGHLHDAHLIHENLTLP